MRWVLLGWPDFNLFRIFAEKPAVQGEEFQQFAVRSGSKVLAKRHETTKRKKSQKINLRGGKEKKQNVFYVVIPVQTKAEKDN